MNTKPFLFAGLFCVTLLAGLFGITFLETNLPQNGGFEPKPSKHITILPLGMNLPGGVIKSVYSDIKRFLPGIEIASNKPLPPFAFNKVRARFRADSLIRWMSGMAKPDQILIGITDVDISTTKDGKQDLGVMGLGFQPGKAAIASNFRMKNKDQFWKVAIHELGHTSGLTHCPVKTCFMRDAEGGNPTAEEKEFCPKCKSTLLKQGWRL